MPRNWISTIGVVLMLLGFAVLFAGCRAGSAGCCCGSAEWCVCFDPRDNSLESPPSCDGRCLTVRNRQGQTRCLGPVK